MDLSELDLRLYPNPTHNVLNFSQEVDRFDVFDLMGRYLFSGNGSYLDVSKLDQGMYLINLSLEESVRSSKFLKL